MQVTTNNNFEMVSGTTNNNVEMVSGESAFVDLNGCSKYNTMAIVLLR